MLADLKAFDEAMKKKTGKGLKQIVEYQSYPEIYQDLAVRTRRRCRQPRRSTPGTRLIQTRPGHLR